MFIFDFTFACIQTYFEDNPRDLQLLRHDKDLHPAVVKPHLKNVPDYLGKKLESAHTERVNQRSFVTNGSFIFDLLSPRVLERRHKSNVTQEQEKKEGQTQTRSSLQTLFQGEHLNGGGSFVLTRVVHKLLPRYISRVGRTVSSLLFHLLLSHFQNFLLLL